MPVPRGKRKLYSTIVAANTARLKRKGMDPSAANEAAKKIADEAVLKKGGEKK